MTTPRTPPSPFAELRLGDDLEAALQHRGRRARRIQLRLGPAADGQVESIVSADWIRTTAATDAPPWAGDATLARFEHREHPGAALQFHATRLTHELAPGDVLLATLIQRGERIHDRYLAEAPTGHTMECLSTSITPEGVLVRRSRAMRADRMIVIAQAATPVANYEQLEEQMLLPVHSLRSAEHTTTRIEDWTRQDLVRGSRIEFEHPASFAPATDADGAPRRLPDRIELLRRTPDGNLVGTLSAVLAPLGTDMEQCATEALAELDRCGVEAEGGPLVPLPETPEGVLRSGLVSRGHVGGVEVEVNVQIQKHGEHLVWIRSLAPPQVLAPMEWVTVRRAREIVLRTLRIAG